MISLYPQPPYPLPPPLISIMVSVDVKHHVYLLNPLSVCSLTMDHTKALHCASSLSGSKWLDVLRPVPQWWCYADSRVLSVQLVLLTTSLFTHTHTQLTRTYYMHADAHIHTQTLPLSHTHTHARMYTPTHQVTHARTDTRTCAHYMHADAHIHTQTLSLSHTHTPSYTHTHTTHTHVHTLHARRCTHTHTNTLSLSHTHTHTHTSACIHPPTKLHTHTHSSQIHIQASKEKWQQLWTRTLFTMYDVHNINKGWQQMITLFFSTASLMVHNQGHPHRHLPHRGPGPPCLRTMTRPPPRCRPLHDNERYLCQHDVFTTVW